jgi:hypothetical protein
MKIVAAAFLYSITVFAAGFVFGAIRVLWLEPRIGPLAAVLCESPLLLVAMAFAARWVPKLLRLRRDLASLGAMGLGALAVQQVIDLTVGFYVRGITPAEQFAHFATAPGLVYAALLVAFVAMPILLNRQTAELP